MRDTIIRFLSALGNVKERKALLDVISPIGDRLTSQPLTSAGLAIVGGGNTAAKIGATDFYAIVNGVLVKIAASTTLTALAGTITATKYNVFCFFVDSGGTVTTLMGREGAAIGNIVFPEFPKNKALVGFLIVTYASTFTGGSTALDTATTVYVNPIGAFDPTVLTG
jgi:hypothetical protein